MERVKAKAANQKIEKINWEDEIVPFKELDDGFSLWDDTPKTKKRERHS